MRSPDRPTCMDCLQPIREVSVFILAQSDRVFVCNTCSCRYSGPALQDALVAEVTRLQDWRNQKVFRHPGVGRA